MVADCEELRLQIVRDFAEAYWWVVEVRCSQGVIFGAVGGRFFTEDTGEIEIRSAGGPPRRKENRR